MVWLNTKNLNIKRFSCKLKNIYNRKYIIKKIISPHTIKLELHSELQMHLIFHINLLQPAATNLPHLSNVQPLGPFINFDKEIKYEILEIINSYFFGRTKKLQYCIY